MTTQTPQVTRSGHSDLIATIKIGNQVVRTRTPRRFVVVAFRPEAITGQTWDYRTESYQPSTYVPFIDVEKRTDNYKSAEAAVRQIGRAPGMSVVIVDTAI